MNKLFVFSIFLVLVYTTKGCLVPYTIQWGDTCNSISQKTGISFNTIIASSKPIDCGVLQPGQTICLQKSGVSNFDVYACTATHTISAGETCQSIVNSRGITLDDLYKYNPGLNCDSLQRGQDICINSNFAVASKCTNTYTVKPGETCLSIAKSNSIPFNTMIASAKPIDCSTLQPGQTFCIKKNDVPLYTEYQCTSTYTVTWGDTCDNIASSRGLTVQQLRDNNPGLNCDSLQRGQPLCLNGGTANSVTTIGAVVTTIAAPVCSIPYEVKAGDTCLSIAQNNNIPFNTIIASSKPIDCRFLQPGQRICLQLSTVPRYTEYQCASTHTVGLSETCSQIAASRGLTLQQLIDYNPGLNCDSLQLGQFLCLNNPTATVPPTPAATVPLTPAVTIPLTQAAVTTIAAATTIIAPACLISHVVTAGDTCLSIAQNNNIPFNTMIASSKPIDCRFLQPGQRICLQLSTVPRYTEYKCTNYHTVSLAKTCSQIAASRGLTLQQLVDYNPGLNCDSLQLGQSLCLDDPASTVPPTPAATVPLTPAATVPLTPGVTTIAGAIATAAAITTAPACAIEHVVTAGDTCLSIAQNNNIPFNTMIASSKPIDCRFLQPGQRICLQLSTVPRYPEYQCANHHTVSLAKTCSQIAASRGLTLQQLVDYNPGLNCDSLQLGQSLCLDDPAATVPPTPAATVPLTPAATVPPTPAATTTAVPTTRVLSCVGRTQVLRTDTCQTIATRARITVTELQQYNPTLSCSALPVNQLVCVRMA